jgi:hypothetical protein
MDSEVITLYACMYLGCSRCYNTLSSLKRHVLSAHVKQNRCMCTVCFKWFASESSLSKHRARHGLKNLQHCSICDKKYKDSSSLLLHRRKHSPSETCLSNREELVQDSLALRCTEKDAQNVWSDMYQTVELPPLRYILPNQNKKI